MVIESNKMQLFNYFLLTMHADVSYYSILELPTLDFPSSVYCKYSQQSRSSELSKQWSTPSHFRSSSIHLPFMHRNSLQYEPSHTTHTTQ